MVYTFTLAHKLGVRACMRVCECACVCVCVCVCLFVDKVLMSILDVNVSILMRVYAYLVSFISRKYCFLDVRLLLQQSKSIFILQCSTCICSTLIDVTDQIKTSRTEYLI